MTDTQTKLYVGCISGTSVDGLDIALIAVDGSGSLVVKNAETAAFPDPLRKQLLAIAQPGHDNLDELGRCDSKLGQFTGEAINTFLDKQNIPAEQITAIGSHGQTVRHRPPDTKQPFGFTHQIGDPNHIAEITGIQTVADFRRRDMAAGGHGAPLVPPFHNALFSKQEAAVVLNIGGISNISILMDTPSGFDTGPGNGLLDSWVERHTGKSYDNNGEWAATGRVDETLLKKLLADPYFDVPPPKSTGREYFNLAWLDNLARGTNTQPVDVQATLCALTARCTLDAVRQFAPGSKKLIVCGGGRLNNTIMAQLRLQQTQPQPIEVVSSEQLGVDGDSVEAALFAWLAHRTLSGLAGNEPAVTGASGYRVLGAVYPA